MPASKRSLSRAAWRVSSSSISRAIACRAIAWRGTTCPGGSCREGSIHLAFAAGPIRLAQLALQDLARGIARQRLDEIDGARHLVAGDPLARELDELARRQRCALLLDDDRLDRLAPLIVGHADHGDIGDGGMGEERAFDLRGIDVLAARDDHVLHAIVNEKIAVLVHIAG